MFISYITPHQTWGDTFLDNLLIPKHHSYAQYKIYQLRHPSIVVVVIIKKQFCNVCFKIINKFSHLLLNKQDYQFILLILTFALPNQDNEKHEWASNL